MVENTLTTVYVVIEGMTWYDADPEIAGTYLSLDKAHDKFEELDFAAYAEHLLMSKPEHSVSLNEFNTFRDNKPEYGHYARIEVWNEDKPEGIIQADYERITVERFTELVAERRR